jgi:DNA ligase D-like protein (predicted ligase)
MQFKKPSSLEPMLCTSAEQPPEGDEWRYELKLDGFRALGRHSGRSAQVWSRNQKSLTSRFPTIAEALRALPRDTVIDGEIVALDEGGKPSFNLLQGYGTEADTVMYAFDVIMLRGKDMRAWALEERRAALHDVVCAVSGTIRYSENFNVPCAQLVEVVREQRLEGIVAKRTGSPYRSGERSGDWLKWRADRGQEFVIGGYVPDGDRIESLLVGYYSGGDLLYAARVRAGISVGTRRVLMPFLQELLSPQCPFTNLPERTEGRWGEGLTLQKMQMCHWLEPFLVARIEFLEWTPENRLRHPRFAGIRDDKGFRDVVREDGLIVR